MINLFDRNGKLRIEFQTTFYSTFWELYLFIEWLVYLCQKRI